MLKVRRTISKIAAAVMAAAIIIGMPVGLTAKADGLDITKPVSLTIQVNDPDTKNPVQGMKFRAYRVADYLATGEFALLTTVDNDVKSAYKKIDVSEPSAEDCATFAKTVSGYFTSKNVTPDAVGTTDNTGKAVLGGNDLKAGMYVVLSDPIRISNGDNSRIYTMGEILVSLPWRQRVEPEWDYDYDIDIAAKLEVVDRTAVHVIKSWVGDGGTSSVRPTEITVELLGNGLTVDTQRLSAANNWTYDWTDLDSDTRWTVIERNVPQNYVQSLNQTGYTFQIINTYVEPFSPPPVITPEPPIEYVDVPPPEVMGVRRVPAGPDVQETIGEVLGASRLPQTGVLWWPVPILFLAGGAMFVYGFRDVTRER